jgi:uncharacterized protein
MDGISRSLIYSFRTKKGNIYVYNAATNNIYHANDLDLFILNNLSLLKRSQLDSDINQNFKDKDLLNSVQRVTSWLNDINQFKKSFRLVEFDEKEDYEKEKDNLSLLILEVTERCNLQCDYCYRKEFMKKGAPKSMSWQVAKKAIDYFIDRITSPYRTRCKGNCHLSFYGGEPLLNAKLIEKCIDYINTIRIDDKISYHVTTNLTIMNSHIADLLIKNNIQLTVSLDGPEKEHDKNRKYKNGKGSYSDVIQNLRFLKEYCPGYFERNAMFNAVYNVNSDIENIVNFFSDLNNDLIPGIRVRFNFDPISKISDLESINNYRTYLSRIKGDFLRLRKLRRKTKKESSLCHVIKSFLAPFYYPIQNRTYRDPSMFIFGGAICKAGTSRLYVDVNGNFRACEQIHNTFETGNCWEGISYEKAKKLFDEFKKKIMWECQNCIAVNFCKICYVAVAKNGKMDKGHSCEKQRKYFIEDLKDYCSMKEEFPEVFEGSWQFWM